MLPDVTRTGADPGIVVRPGPTTATLTTSPTAPAPGSASPAGVSALTISAGTLRRIELAAGELAAACLAAMEDRQPWFARLPADQRSGVRLVTQTGVANFVAWLGQRGETIRLTAEAFRIAPHELARRLSLRQTVDLVRIATEVFERQLPPLATDEAERRALVEGVLRFGREIAFAAATVYAGAAETRGAWDARLEALVVDAVVRGDGRGPRSAGLPGRGAGLGLAAPRVRVRGRQPGPRTRRRRGGRRAARAAATPGGRVLVGLQGSRLVCWSAGRARNDGRPGRGGCAWPALRARPWWSARRRPTSAAAHGSGRGRAGRAAGCARLARRPRGRSPPTTCCLNGRWPATPRAPPAARDRSSSRWRPPAASCWARWTAYLEGGGVLESLRPGALRARQHRALPAAPRSPR